MPGVEKYDGSGHTNRQLHLDIRYTETVTSGMSGFLAAGFGSNFFVDATIKFDVQTSLS